MSGRETGRHTVKVISEAYDRLERNLPGTWRCGKADEDAASKVKKNSIYMLTCKK